AIRERRRDLPGGNRDREVPRRDQTDDAERLARRLDVDARPHRRDLLAGDPQAFAGEEQEDLARSDRLANRLGERLALFAREQPPELVLARKDLVADALQDVVPLLDAAS